LRLISSMLTLLAYLLACIFASNLIETPYTIGSFAYFVQFSKVYLAAVATFISYHLVIFLSTTFLKSFFDLKTFVTR